MLSVPPCVRQARPEYQSAAPRLLERVREVICRKHYSLRTEEAYVDCVRRFVRCCPFRHPRERGARELEAFFTDLAVHGPRLPVAVVCP
ncbi:MAG TPA: site-specific integrase [Burkholderiales bacterium]|nr:site-specific integrase [Burkholderiales bacterium]